MTKPKLFGEKTMEDMFQRSRRQTIEFWSFVFSIIALFGGGLWYASSLVSKQEAKALAVEQMQKCPSKISFIQLKTRFDIEERRNKEWRKEVKKSLSDIKTSIQSLSDRLPRQNYRYRNKTP